MGVVVRMYIDILIIIITFPYSTCIYPLFFGSNIPISLFILNVFLFLFMLFLCNVIIFFEKYYRHKFLIKIFLPNKNKFKIKSILIIIRIYMYKVVTEVITR